MPKTAKDFECEIPGEEDTVAGWIAKPDTPIEWTIDQLMSEGTDLYISGGTGLCKSWDTMRLCFEFETGGMWHNLRCKRLHPIYISLELTENQMKPRIRKLAEQYPAVRDAHFLARKGCDYRLNTRQGRDNLRALLYDYGGDFGVIVLDPLSLFIKGQMDRIDWNNDLYPVLVELKKEFGCSLILNHNNRKKIQIYGHDVDSFAADNLKGVSEIIDRADNIVVLISESQPRKTKEGKSKRREVSRWIHAAKTRDNEWELKPHRINWNHKKGIYEPVQCPGWTSGKTKEDFDCDE